MIPNVLAMKRYMERHLETVRRKRWRRADRRKLCGSRKTADKSARMKSWPWCSCCCFAGHETTTHLISGSVYELLKNPDLRDWLEKRLEPCRSGGGRIFCASSRRLQFTKAALRAQGYRAWRRHSEKRANRIMAMLAAANMDPQANAHPRTARSTAQAEPAHRLRHRDPFSCLGHQLGAD